MKKEFKIIIFSLKGPPQPIEEKLALFHKHSLDLCQGK